jgi:hypothetical protein
VAAAHVGEGRVLDVRFSLVTLTLKAKVHEGRLVLDEPIDLPEGTEVELVPADVGDSLDEDDRRRLHAALQRSADQFRAGKGIPAGDVLRELGADDSE